MNKSPFYFTFKPAVESQRELIHQWLQQDYIREWIHGQGLQNTLSGLEKFFQYQANGKGLDRQAKITQHWIGYDGDKPFVYLLTSNVFKNVAGSYAKYSELDGLAVTLDIFIGNTEYLGKGLASAVIKEFLLSEFSDVSEVFIDPEKNNIRATHVYQKIGFRVVGEFIAPWHPVPHHIMKLDMRNLPKCAAVLLP
jgi:RimJ/RimL family protein N-acetyltransferase